MSKRHFILDINGVLILTDRWGNVRTNTELINYLLLKKDTYSFTLLTSNPPEIEHHMEAVYKVPKFYDNFISSATFNLLKSDPRLYEEVMAKLMCPPEACVFVDDTQENVEAAASLGITGILYTNFEEFKTDLEKI